MSPEATTHLPVSGKHRLGHLFPGGPCRAATVSGLLLLAVYVSSFNFRCSHYSSDSHLPRRQASWSGTAADGGPTSLSHVVFVIVGSLKTWNGRRAYLESWWRPNVSRGYLFLDGRPKNGLPCQSTCPPLRINEDISDWEIYPQIKYPAQVRIARTVVEAFRQGDRDARWFVVADDDSVLFIDNLVEVLSKYDHTKYFYLGASSETIFANAYLSFEMGFGGAGFALSYPLVAAMAKRLDGCIKRYPDLWSSDYLIYICTVDLGVALSPQKGFHQIDLRDNITGFLSSHPQSPLLSLHHIDVFDPIFPNLSRSESIRRLMKPARVDQSRLLQQTICYQREMNWTISVSWGYSAHIYESMLPRYFLQRPIETFRPWFKNAKWPKFMFNTRSVEGDPCEDPHWFFFETVEGRDEEDDILTTYIRSENRGLGSCSLTGNHSADHISRIQVLSPAKARLEAGSAECCDVLLSSPGKNTTTVRIRPCMEAEEIV